MQTEPREVVVDLRLERGPGAGAVDIFDPQQEPPPRRTRKIMGDGGGIGVTQMQRPGR